MPVTIGGTLQPPRDTQDRRFFRPKGPMTYEQKVDQAIDIYNTALDIAEDRGCVIKATFVLFSGGNDSTTVAHMFKDDVDYAAHANTGIGIEATRQYVRDTCKMWDLPLIEEHVKPGRTYRDMVLGEAWANARDGSGKRSLWKGFPGPSGHQVMFTHLKARSLERIRNQFIDRPRKERVVFVGGIRRDESDRRSDRDAIRREGSIVWCSPLINWTKVDLNEYRRRNDVPRNEVADHIHMSGECLCGAYAKEGELDMIGFFFPEFVKEIRELEREAAARGLEYCKWGTQGKGTPCEGICNLLGYSYDLLRGYQSCEG